MDRRPSAARNAVARRPTRRGFAAGAVWIFLFLMLSTTFVSAARADAFAAGSRAYAARNYVLAAQIFLPLAEQRDARAQTYLGVMYLRGEGVPQNFPVAAYWLQARFGGRRSDGPVLPWIDVRQGTRHAAGLRACTSVAEPRRRACRAETAGPLGAHSQRGRFEDDRGATRRGPATCVRMASPNRIWRSTGVLTPFDNRGRGSNAEAPTSARRRAQEIEAFRT